MADENCKLIEQHIKHLLSLPPENSQNVPEPINNSLETRTHVDGPYPSLNKANYGAFNPAFSPQKAFRTNAAQHTRSPVSHTKEDTRGFSNHVPGNVDQTSYRNISSPFPLQNFPRAPPGFVSHQMHDLRFLNIQHNSEQVNGASQSYSSSPDFKNSVNSPLQREAICDKAPITSEKLYVEKPCQEVVQTSPHPAGNKSDFKKDAKNKKRKKKDKKKRMRHSPDSSVIGENINMKLDLPCEISTPSNILLQEKFTPLQQKGDSPAATPERESQFIKRVNKIPFFSESKESVILRREGQLYFCCYVCDYNCTDVPGVNRHIGSSNHKSQLKAKETRHLLFHLPKPLPKQVESVTNCIIHVANVYGLSEDYLNLRKTVVDRIKEKIEIHIPGCHLEPIGSSITGFGLKTSHIDIVLKVPKEKNAADVLFTTFERLEGDKSFKDVHKEFRKKIPQIEFVDAETNLTCNICIDNGTVSGFTKLLCAYAKMDPRVRILGTVFRYWAKICEVDQQDQGTLPSFCYILMVIYFLQQQNPPVLPVIEEDSDWCSSNNASIGELWISLFRYYSIEYQCGEDVVCIRKSEKISCEDKNWGTKILAIEDPIVQRNLAHVIPNRQVYQYIHDCLVQTYNYFGRPQFHTGPAELTCVSKSDKSDLLPNTLSSKNGNMIFRSTVVEKKPNFSEVPPLSDDILDVSDLVEDHDPQLPFDDVISIVNNLTIDEIVSEEEFERDSSDSLADWGKNTFDSCRTHDMSPSLFANFPSLTIIPHDQGQSLPKVDNENTEEKQSNQCGFPDHSVASYSQRYSWNLDEDNIMEEMYYEFHPDHFRGDKSVPLVCSLCQKQGHQKKDCPDEILPAVVTLPPMTPEYIRILDSVCQQILEENQPSEAELRMRDEDLQELEDYIRQIFSHAKLQMFGSFCNGFGFTKSDMDICLTFKNNTSGKDLDYLSVIEQLAQLLNKNPKLSNVVPITSAKVPIVKFVFKDSGLEGDISLYNTLAQHNTKMLDMYCKIDQRVRVLGYTLKYFAKILNIGDASRGSLSSYAYILMVLFFLQQRKPPVIPVLQELHNGKQPVLMVDEWNAWFYSDLKNLPKVWTDYGKNKESVGELWLGLLRFYTEEFDSNEYVVCIRQKKFLTRFRKLWNSKSIAIEDPFDLSHNLGSGLSRRMNNYILKAFIRGRNHFGMAVDKIQHVQSAKDFLFDRHVLCEGQDPPNDRGCRYCGKIGHVIKDCPKKTQKKQDQRKPNGPKNQGTNNNSEEQTVTHRHGFPERWGYPRREYERRNRHHGNRSPRKNNTQQNISKGNFERTADVPPGKISHVLSLQRFPAPNVVPNSINPPPFASKIPASFVHRPATSTPFPIINSGAVVTSLSPHQNSLTQHTATYASSPQTHPAMSQNAQGGNSHSLTSQKNIYLPSENSLPHGGGGAHSNLGLIHLPSGKYQQFRNHPRDEMYGSHNASSRW